MLPVLIPFDDEARGLLKDLETTERVGEIARRLQPYVVQVPPGQFARLCAAGVVQPVAPERFGEQFWRSSTTVCIGGRRPHVERPDDTRGGENVSSSGGTEFACTRHRASSGTDVSVPSELWQSTVSA